MTFADRHVYCHGDPLFYESPARGAGQQELFAAGGRAVPAGWKRSERDVWVSLVPDGHEGPAQGWKVHASAAPESAAELCDRVWDYCVRQGVPFKQLRDRVAYLVYNSKYAPRAASGKLVTIYPKDETQLRRLLDDLSDELRDVRGPYILSDVRWGQGPLFVRYGGFTERYCTVGGRQVLAVAKPDGTLVPDDRRPVFKVPDWVTTPDFLAGSIAARGGGSMPYRVHQALHFSNAGGVYAAERVSDGQRVVLKEARPFAGLDRGAQDARARLANERWALERLAGLPGVPRLFDHFTAGEHDFIAMENVEGSNLWVWMARSHPMVVQDEPTPAQYARYAERAVDILARVESVVAGIHERGVVFGDLHFGNVIVGDDGEVHLIDFELAFEGTDLDHRPRMHTMGFTAGPQTGGFDLDRYSMAALKAALFFPLEKVRALEPGKLGEHLGVIAERFPLPAGFLASVRRDLDGLAGQPEPGFPPTPIDVDLDVERADWDSARDSMVAGILASATPGRPDRIFPGDVAQFTATGGGATFAYGAAGILWTLSVVDASVPAYGVEWLSGTVRTGLPRCPGFYDGLHGVAFGLHHLGLKAEALEVLDRADEMVGDLRDVSLFSGLAGVGLSSLHLAVTAGESRLTDAAVRIAERVVDRLTAAADGNDAAGNAGLMRGWSGVALFLARMYESTGDAGYLDQAIRALHLDIDRCVRTRSGSLQVEETKVRTLAYLDVGSAGIALVADEVLPLRDDERIRTSVPDLLRACATEFVLQPQLFAGRAGLVAALARNGTRDSSLDTASAVHRHLQRFSWHALSYRGHLAFPGDFSLRLSMDLATGVAGVLLATSAVTGPTGAFLPFFTPRPTTYGPADTAGS